MKRRQVEQLLDQIKEQCDEFLDQEFADELSSEELVIAAVEIVTSNIVTTIEYTSVIGEIDRSQVEFFLDDDLSISIYSPEEEYEDED